jgi:hypothetical protein
MSISIKKHKPPDLKRVRFNCDSKLCEKLDEYELLSNLNRSHFLALIGKAGSGKTAMMVSLLKSPTAFRGIFENIMIIIPPTSRASIENHFFEKNLPSENIYDELTIENLQEINDRIEANSSAGERTLLIMDDVQRALKDNDVRKLVLNLNNNRRHLKLSMWILAQNFTKMEKSLRMGLTDVIVFKVGKVEFGNIFEELIEMSQDMFKKVLKYFFKEAYSFMYLNTNTQRIFSNFDEIIIEE